MKVTTYDYSKLLGRIKEKGFTQDSLCAEIRMDRSVFSLRINNKRRFRQNEIDNICKILEINCDSIGKYFFVH